MSIKIQHYVPRFYLKNFQSRNKNNNIYINCYDKPTKKQFETNIANIGCEKYFYDLEEDINQVVEQTLGINETLFNQSYGKIIKYENLDNLTNEDFSYMSYFIASQLLRTREARIRLKEIIQQVKQKISDRATDDLKKELDNAMDKKSIKKQHIKSLIESVPELANIIYKMKWMVGLNKTNNPLWTSDNPITLDNKLNYGPFGNLGLLVRGIEIHFPLSSKITLVILDPVTFKSFPDFMELDDEENVIYENQLQVFWSTQHLLSSDNDFSLADTILNEYPQYANINRKRWGLN